MSETTEHRAHSLSKLAINRVQRPTASRRGRWGLIGLILLVALLTAGAGWWYYNTTGVNIVAALGTQPIEVNLLVVPNATARAGEVVFVANGKIVSDRRVNVATKVSGQIVELKVEQGDIVKENDVLARVEDVIYKAQRDDAAATMSRRKHEIDLAKAEFARTEAAVLQMRADYEFQKRNFERLERLHETQQASDFEFYNSKNQYEASSAAHDVAIAVRQSASVSVHVAESELKAAEAMLSIAEKRLNDCDIRAPISGVILNRNAQVGDFLAAEGGRGAQANAQLVEIADMTLLRVEIDVGERDVYHISAGQATRVTPDSDKNDIYDGQVMWIDPIGDYAKATVQVKVRIKNPGPDLRVEGTAKVEFLSPTPATGPANAGSAMWMPKKAVKLISDGEDALVFTVENNRAVAHPVKIGTRTDKNVEIKAGVSAGMQIVAENVNKMENGTTIKVIRTITPDEQ